jgi:CDGSH-type Zn-finger protein
MIEQYWRTDLELVTEQQRKCCRCGQPMIEQGFASRTLSKEAASLPIAWQPPNEHEEPMRVLVLSAAKVWQCACGAPVEQPVERG